MPKEEKYALYKIGWPEESFCFISSRAYLTADGASGAPVWIPKSIVILDPPDDMGVRNFHVPAWFFKKNKILPENLRCGEFRGIVGLII